ncbi:hypothetical protein NC651_026088 [Populus alba x Populus x berolinensis]|nr:hypothetical protein NC651_026088 [Populus alba x Populus x berolinensis]
MEIIDCPKIVSLPEESLEGLSSLRSLSIENCHGLASQPSRMQHATALESLTIMYCSNLVSLPYGLQQMKKEQTKEISNEINVRVLTAANRSGEDLIAANRSGEDSKDSTLTTSLQNR